MPRRRRAQPRAGAGPRSTVELLDPELHDDPWIDHGELDTLLRSPSVLATTADPARDGDTATENTRSDDLRPHGTIMRAGKLAGLVIATALLCGAVVAAPALVDASSGPPRAVTLDDGAATGVRALLGTTALPLADGTDDVSPGTGMTEPASPDSVTDPATDRAPQRSQREPEAGSTAADTPPSAEDVVRTFYDRVPTDPEGAVAMLADEVIEASGASRVHAWRTASDLEVHELHIRSDEVIRALVTLTDPTGARLRLDQLLRISTEPEPSITEVRLLSSQHVPPEGS